MKKLFLYALIFIGINAKAQTSDYCFEAKENWTPLHEAVCFDSQMSFEIGTFFAEKFNKYYKQPTFWATNNNNPPKILDSAFVMQEFTGTMKSITRISFDVTKNMRLSIATLPFDSFSSYANAQIVAIVKTDGECQLLCEGRFLKEKIKNGENVSIYKASTITKEIIVNGEKMKIELNLYYTDGTILRYVEVNNIMVKI